MRNEPIKILVVDDLPGQLVVYRSILEDDGQEVVAVSSGADALREVLRHDFAVILLDVNMPVMDGFETAALIRARRRSALTPIIFVTAHADELHTLRGYSYGAVDFILSPVVPEILRTKVKVFVDLFRLNQHVRDQAAREVASAEREQARLADLLERGTDFVARIETDLSVSAVNRAGREMLGYGPDGLPRRLSAYYPRASEELLLSVALPGAKRDGVWIGEGALRARDGREITVSQVVFAHAGIDGQVEQYSVVARDISQRRAAERALAASEQRYRQLVQRLPAAAYTCDAQGYITLYNEAAVALWGRAPVLGQDRWCGSWRMRLPGGESLAPDESPMARVLTEGRSEREVEIIIEREDGSRSSVLAFPEPIVDASGAVAGAVNMLVDITDRKKAEQARDLLAAIVSSTDDAIISKRLDGVITTCNPAAERLFGWGPGELVGRSILSLIPPERHGDEELILGRINQGLSVLPFDTVRMRKDGTRIDVSVSVSPVRDRNGNIVGASKIARDIGERKRAEQALRTSEGRLRAMFGQAAVGIALLDDSGRILESNDRLASIVGRGSADVLGRTCGELAHPDDWDRMHDLIEQVLAGSRSECSVEGRFACADGSWAWVNLTISPLADVAGGPRLIAVIEDIGLRKQAEFEVRRHREQLEQLVAERTADLRASHERLRLTERLAAVGTLAAGLGHDMGNLLLPMRMRIDALERTSLPEEARKDIRAIGEACEYLKRLSQGLRLFALNPEDGASANERTDLHAWWEDVATFLRNVLSRGIELEAGFPRDLPMVAISGHGLTQVIYNLVQNAGDAMKGRGRGRVSVTAELSADGSTVLLEVSDDGPGMSEEVMRRCLEPFYTTKTRGISTGLGLALVHGALRKVGGSVEVRSQLGSGTTFRLTLPTLAAPDKAARAVEPKTACVDIADARVRAFVQAELKSHNVSMLAEPWSKATPATLLVVDRVGARVSDLAEFLSADPSRLAIVLDDAEVPGSRQVIAAGPRATLSVVRRKLQDALRSGAAALEEVVT